MTLVTRRYVHNAIDQAQIQGEVQVAAAVVSAGITQIDIQVDDATSGVEGTLDDFMLRKGFRFLEQSPITPLYSRFFRQTFLEGEKEILADPTTIGGLILDVSAWATVTGNAVLIFEGAYKAVGATSTWTMTSQNPDGSSQSIILPDPVTFADTAGAYVSFEILTTSELSAGVLEYIAEGRLNGSTSLTFKNLSVSLVEVTVP